jgi:putative ABC transport system permease protein
MWLLAIKAMFGDRGKLMTSLLGVTFSVVLVNLQGGLFWGLIQKASLLVDYSEADIWVGHKHMNNVDVGTYIPERWIHRIRSLPDVERADPYLVAFCEATMPDGQFETVILVGCDADSLLGNASLMAEGDRKAVRLPDGVIVDECDAYKLGEVRIGDIREINGHRARIVGLTSGIVGFTTSPYVFTTLERARSHFGAYGVRPDQCSYYLVKAKPGADVDALCARIRQRLPDLDVYDRQTYSRICMTYWLTRTGIGISFGLATFLGLLVGLAVVAQTLYATVAERVKEFAMLKALGAADRSISRLLLAQALGNAMIGSVLGLMTAFALGRLLTSPRAPVELTKEVAAASVLLTVLVCLVGAVLPYWRIRGIDPAGVLRA